MRGADPTVAVDEAYSMEASEHATDNVGDTTIRALMFEPKLAIHGHMTGSSRSARRAACSAALPNLASPFASEAKLPCSTGLSAHGFGPFAAERDSAL